MSIHLIGLILCITILMVTTFEKFAEGGWITFLITSVVIGGCYLIRNHYEKVRDGIRQLDEIMSDIPTSAPANTEAPDPKDQTAIQLVSGYSGFGVHTLLSIMRTFPKTYKNVIFVSVAVVDSGSFKGADELHSLETSVRNGLERYVGLARRLGFAADYRMLVGTDVVESATQLCKDIAEEYRNSTVFTGQITFRLEKFYHKILHNETAYAIQRHLQWSGITTVIMPIRLVV